ncbi:MAG: hypothetical protein PHE83_15085 [Opitutaceae bacterium]|nr:hypothetical protein [Opitutaceae bacterium]
MGDANKQIGYEITAENGQFVRAMEGAASVTQQATANIKGHLEGVGKAFDVVQKQLLVLAAVVAGGAFFKDAIAESQKLIGETMNLSKRLGMTAEDASALNTALGDIGSDSDTYIGAFDKFAKQLRTNEDGLKAMGLQTRDASGHLRDSNTLFQEAVAVVGTYKPGLDQTTAAQTLFGKGVEDVMKLQKLNNQVLEDARKKNEELGLVVTKEGVEASKAYKMAMNDVGDVLLAVKNVIGQAVMPIFAELGNLFAEAGPQFVAIFRGALTALTLVFRGLQATVKTVAAGVFEFIGQTVDQLGHLSELMGALMSGDFKGAADAWDRMKARYAQGIRNVVNAGREAFSDASDAWGGDMGRIWGKGTAVAAPKGGGKTMGEFGKDGGKKGKTEDRMGQWEAELSEQKLAISERARAEGAFRQMSKQEELAYWQEILNRGGLTHKELLAVRKKVAEDGLAIDKQAFETRMEDLKAERDQAGQNFAERSRLAAQSYAETVGKYGEQSKEAKKAYAEILAEHRAFIAQARVLEDSAAEARREKAAAGIELERIALQERVSLGDVTRAEALQAEQQFEQRLYDIKAKALQERLALIDTDRDPVAREQVSRQIEQAEAQHQQRMAQLRSQSTIEAGKGFSGMVSSMQSGWGSLLAKMAQGQLTITGLMRGLFQNTFQVVTQTLGQLAAKWVAQRIGLSSLESMLMGKQVAEQATASGAVVATKAGEATAVVTANAAEGATGAAAAVAPIPIVGPGMAAAAFAGTMALLMGAMGSIKSASGGYDIPAGVNPMVQAHAEEMILPAKYANLIRGMADGGGDAGGGGGGSLAVSVTAMDSRDVVRSLARGGALSKAMAKAHRNFQKV